MSEEYLVENYYEWLVSDAFKTKTDRTLFRGVLGVLHEIPFYWTIWSDENRAGDALSYRQYDYLGTVDVEQIEAHWLHDWAEATPSVLEVLLGIARRWSYYFEDEPYVYFHHLFYNLNLEIFPGGKLSTDTQNDIRDRMDIWMSRTFHPDGRGSPFPIDLKHALDVVDMRSLDIWRQMNVYSLEHFQ